MKNSMTTYQIMRKGKAIGFPEQIADYGMDQVLAKEAAQTLKSKDPEVYIRKTTRTIETEEISVQGAEERNKR